MQNLTETSVQNEILQGEIHIRVWEVFLSHSRNNLVGTLETYSLSAPIHDLNYEGTITFKFTPFDWNRSVKSLLQKNNIPFIEGELVDATIA